MCRMHIKTVREIRREESLIHPAPAFDLGDFSQWISDNLPWPPVTTDTFLPGPPMFFSDIMQLPGGLLQTAHTVGVSPPSAATEQLQPQTSAASNQSQNGSQEPSEHGMNGFLHQIQEDGGQNQQPHPFLSELSQQLPVSFGEFSLPIAGFFQFPEDSSGSSQESQAVISEPVFPAFPQTGTNEPTQPSQAVLHALVPSGYETMNGIFQLQAGPSGLFQQPQGDGPSQQAHSSVGGSADHLSSTSTSGLSAPQTNTSGSLQQLGNSLLGHLLHQIHHIHQMIGINNHTQVNNQEINLQHQSHPHGSVSGFSQQFHPSPNGSSLQLHPGPSGLSSQSHVGLTGLVLPVVTIESISQQHQVGTDVPSASPEVSNNGPSEQEVPVSGHSNVPSFSIVPYFLPPFVGNGGHPQGNTSTSGSSQQPGNTNALFHHSHITMGGLSQQSQAAASETSQQPQGNTNENAQHLQTDTDVLSQTSVGELSEESQSDAEDF